MVCVHVFVRVRGFVSGCAYVYLVALHEIIQSPHCLCPIAVFARTLRRYHWPARGVTPPAARTPPLDLAEAKLASGLPELSGSISASTLWSL